MNQYNTRSFVSDINNKSEGEKVLDLHHSRQNASQEDVLDLSSFRKAKLSVNVSSPVYKSTQFVDQQAEDEQIMDAQVRETQTDTTDTSDILANTTGNQQSSTEKIATTAVLDKHTAIEVAKQNDNLSNTEIIEQLGFRSKKLAVLLYNVRITENVKSAFLEILGDLTLDQIDTIIAVLEARLLHEATRQIDIELDNQVKQLIAERQQADDKRAVNLIAAISKL